MSEEKTPKENITTNALISEVAEETYNEIQDVKYVMDVFLALCSKYIVEGHKVTLTNLISMELIDCKSKSGLNNFGKPVIRPAFKKLKTRAGAGLRKMWNEEAETDKEKEANKGE